MIKALLWIVSNDGRFFKGAISILERQHNGIEIVGVTAGAPIQIKKDGKNIPFIPLAELNNFGGECDVLLVVGAKQIGMSRITQAARQLKFPEEKLLGDWIVCIPGFTLKKYRHLQRSRLSIFSLHCFGGCISNTLGLSFRSPFVNLYLEEPDFIKFLHAPRIYIEAEPQFEKIVGFSEENPNGYPLLSLGNILLNMKHYKKVDESIETWNKRKQRINWYNLFVVAYTEDEKFLREFDEMPYGKKACFVPFKSDLDSAWYVNRNLDKRATMFVHNINHFGNGNPFYYDPFDMLLYGKKTQLIDM